MGSPIDEEAVKALIAEKTELEMKMGDPQVQKDQQQARKIGRRHTQLAQIAKSLMKWIFRTL